MKNPIRRSKSAATEPVADMTLIGHLGELRTRLIRSVIAIVVGAIFVWVFFDPIFNFLANPYCDLKASQGDECEFLTTAPLDNFSVVISLSGYGGLILALPVVMYQLGKFVLPGLYPSERKVLLPFFAVSVLLLVLGMVAGYLLMPKALDVLTGFGSDKFVELFSPKSYTSFFIKTLLAFGIAAELPLVLVFLQLVGVVKTETLKKNRRIAIVAVVILAAIVTPTGDPFMLSVLAVPMYLFYEISLIIGGRMTKRRQLALD
ncbi:MAG: twin-arginine translocase subunit TatC [Acidimicrobiales bacterium]